MHRGSAFCALSALSLIAAGTDPCSGSEMVPSFTPIGHAPGGVGSGKAHGISGDGSIVVGTEQFPAGTPEGFRWTSDSSFLGIGDLGGYPFASKAFGISADGSTIVGMSMPSSLIEVDAVRWTSVGGLQSLGDLPGGYHRSSALAASADGSVVVGIANSEGGEEAFRWTPATGMRALGQLSPDVAISAMAYDVSADGTIVVGQSGGRAFIWTETEGMRRLDLDMWGRAYAITPDGSVVVGTQRFGSHAQAFRWTQETGMVNLGGINGSQYACEALDVSADGNVLVGWGTPGYQEIPVACLWREDLGMVHLKEYLANLGVTGLDGWTLREATGVSADGLTISGWGRSPDGDFEGFVATIPSPPTVVVLGVTGAALIGPSRRRL